MRCGVTYTKLGYFSKRGVFHEAVGGTSVPPAAVTRTEVATSLLRERDAVWGNIYQIALVPPRQIVGERPLLLSVFLGTNFFPTVSSLAPLTNSNRS